MAWTDQCKIAFKANADHQIWTQTGHKNITKILRKLSKESGIPFKTLNRWYYEKEKEGDEKLNYLKNEAVKEPTDNKEDNKETSASSVCSIPICIKCKKNPVEINYRTNKPKGQTSKYYGLCAWCRQKAKIIDTTISLAAEDGIGEWTRCPKCHHYFLIPKKEG